MTGGLVKYTLKTRGLPAPSDTPGDISGQKKRMTR